MKTTPARAGARLRRRSLLAHEDVLVVTDSAELVVGAGIVRGVAQVRGQLEDVFQALEQRIVVVGDAGRAARRDERRQQQRTDLVAAVTADDDALDQARRVNQSEATGPHTAEVGAGLL